MICTPEISIIVPVYNAEKWLPKCLDSILSQTYSDFELILVNDGSTDRSLDICETYASKDSRIRVFHKANGGGSSARNLGLDNAKGKWITFCDADDYTFSNWLDNYSIEKTDGIDLVCQGLEASRKDFGDSGEESSFCVAFTGTVIDFYEQVATKYNCLGYTVIKLFRHQIIKDFQLRFDTKIKFHEDNLFVLQYLSHCGRVKCVDKIGYFYFMPDWETKYGINDRKDLLEKLYCSERCFDVLEEIFIDQPKSTGFCNCINDLINDYIVTFRNNPARNYVEKIRQLISRYPQAIQMNPSLKKIISEDSTIYFSRAVLYLYLKLQRIYHKLIRQK